MVRKGEKRRGEYIVWHLIKKKKKRTPGKRGRKTGRGRQNSCQRNRMRAKVQKRWERMEFWGPVVAMEKGFRDLCIYVFFKWHCHWDDHGCVEFPPREYGGVSKEEPQQAFHRVIIVQCIQIENLEMSTRQYGYKSHLLYTYYCCVVMTTLCGYCPYSPIRSLLAFDLLNCTNLFLGCRKTAVSF